MRQQDTYAAFWTWLVPVLLLTAGCGHGDAAGQATTPAAPDRGGRTIGRDQVIAVVEENLKGLRACYHRALAKYQSLRAMKLNLNIELKVHPAGGAGDVFLRGSRVPELTACMKAEILRWRFPAFNGDPVGVAYPLTLSPGPPPGAGTSGGARHAPHEGTLSQSQVVSVIKENVPGLRACHEQVLKTHKGLSASRIKLTIEFKVIAAGNARAVRIINSPVPAMATCIKGEIQRWRFPTFTGQPVGVVYPLTLSPQ